MPRPATLSLELMSTFLRLVENDGDATKTGEELGINQPSMSKRLSYLQHSGRLLPQPWLVREGKTWGLTEEGERVLPAVREIVHRYRQLTDFVEEGKPTRQTVRFGCGQEAIVGFVKDALRELRKKQRSLGEERRIHVRASTIRGRARIEGVANGRLDLATVTHDAAAIRKIARRPLHVEELMSERVVLVCAEKTPWADDLAKLPKTKAPVEGLLRFPLILPEPTSGVRRMVDRSLESKAPLADREIVLEIGGWTAILSYVRDGFGVGLVGTGAIRKPEGLLVRELDPTVVPPIVTRLICRRVADRPEEPDLTPGAKLFSEMIKRVVN